MLRWAVARLDPSVYRTYVGLVWFIPCMLMVTSRAGIKFDYVITKFLEENLERVVACIWYASVAAAFCVACIIVRTFVMLVKVEGFGMLTTILLHSFLAIVISLSLLLGMDVQPSGNTLIEELLLSVYAGYCLYELFYLRVRIALQYNLKMLLIFSALFFIANCLIIQRGATPVLIFLYFFSAPLPTLLLPGLGSSRYRKSWVYRASLTAANFIALFQRGFVGIPTAWAMWQQPTLFRYEHYEVPVLLTLYVASVAACFTLVDKYFRRRPLSEHKGFKRINAREKLMRKMKISEKESSTKLNKRDIHRVYESE